jgi:hypothetical protein
MTLNGALIFHGKERKMRLRAAAMLLVSFLFCRPVFGQSSDNLKNKAIQFLDLSSVASRVRTAGAKAQNPTSLPSTSAAPTREQYVSLYRALTNLQSARAAYLSNLKLYVDSMEARLPQKDRNVRLQALERQVVSLKRGLVALAIALDPLQISLDFQAPSVSDLIAGYAESNQAKVASTSPGVIETLTLPELQSLQLQAIHNGRTLHQAIEQLRAFIKQQYPDIS